LNEELKAIGLTTYQSSALCALLKKRLTLKELSKAANIPRGKVYSAAKQLQEMGLAASTHERPKRLYVPNASETISRLVKSHEEKQQKIISTLQEAATALDRQEGRATPFFELGTTADDNKKIQLRTFVEAEKEVLQVINIHHKPKSNRKSKAIWEKEIEKAVERGVSFKAIYPANAVLPKILEKLNRQNPAGFNIRRLDTDFVRCDIIDSRKVLLKLVHEDPMVFGGIIFIDNMGFAANLKSAFMKFWEEAE